jgi:hypothetical protein
MRTNYGFNVIGAVALACTWPSTAASQTPKVSLQPVSAGDCRIHIVQPTGAVWTGAILLDDEPVRHDLARSGHEGNAGGLVTVFLMEALRPNQYLKVEGTTGWSDQVKVPVASGQTRDPATIECVGGYPRDKREIADIAIRTGWISDSFAPALQRAAQKRPDSEDGQMTAEFGVSYRLWRSRRSPLRVDLLNGVRFGLRPACGAPEPAESAPPDDESDKAPTACDTPIAGPEDIKNIITHATSVEGSVGVRVELARLNKDSDAEAVFYAVGRIGFIALLGADEDTFSTPGVGIGLLFPAGRLRGSHFELSRIANELFVPPGAENKWNRWKFDVLLQFNPTKSILDRITFWKAISRPFLRVEFDNDGAEGPDSLQTMLGTSIDVSGLTGLFGR